jgi:DNA-binding transcriptional regulator YdaS (Cro superfamily)
MHLREYLARPDSLTVSALRHKMNELGAKLDHDAQIRQWIQVDAQGNFKRHPSPPNANFLELATDGKVTRKDMRPKDYAQIWPGVTWPEVERRVGPKTRRVGPADRRQSRS